MVASTSNHVFRQNWVIVALAENLGSSNCQKLQADCNDLQDRLRCGAIRNIVVDCSATKCLGGAALGLLVRLWKSVKQNGGSFVICGLPSIGVETLRVVKLHHLWPIYATLDEGIDAVERGVADDRSLSFA